MSASGSSTWVKPGFLAPAKIIDWCLASRYFFLEFVPKHLNVISGHNLKEIEILVPEDQGRTARLCFFFDRIGWLGAAGVIDVDQDHQKSTSVISVFRFAGPIATVSCLRFYTTLSRQHRFRRLDPLPVHRLIRLHS